jgi:putative membrane protein
MRLSAERARNAWIDSGTLLAIALVAMNRTRLRSVDMLRGIAAGLAGAFAMNQFARGVRAMNGGVEADGAAPGPDRDGRGVQPPQAAERADDDATVRAARVMLDATQDRPRTRETEERLAHAMHYGFGAAAALSYVWSASRYPQLRAGRGILFGTLVWIVADEGLMPALGLSRGPTELSPGVHAYALAGHCVYGAAVDASYRALGG